MTRESSHDRWLRRLLAAAEDLQRIHAEREPVPASFGCHDYHAPRGDEPGFAGCHAEYGMGGYDSWCPYCVDRDRLMRDRRDSRRAEAGAVRRIVTAVRRLRNTEVVTP